MKIKRFEGKSFTEVMQIVKKEFGKDAVIVSTENLNGKVFVTAAKDYDIDTKKPDAEEFRPKPRTYQERAYSDTVFPSVEAPARESREAFSRETSGTYTEIDSLKKEIKRQREKHSKQEEFFLKELGMLRESLSALLQQTVGKDSSIPLQYTPYIKAGIEAGIEEDIIISMLNTTGISKNEVFAEERSARDYLVRSFATMTEAVDLIDNIDKTGGTYLFAGPTGVGKTTSLVKIAANLILQKERNDIALISLDFMRSDGSEQLKRYSKILGVPCWCFSSSEEYAANIQTIKKQFKIILVDTAGVSPLNRESLDFLAKIADSHYTFPVLHIPVATEYEQAFSIFDIFSKVLGEPVVAFTKEDEAMRNGLMASISIARKLRAGFVTNGQKIPEDIIRLKHPLALAELIFSRKYDNI